MNTILITGGAGFIGSNLSIELLKKHKNVIAVDNLSTGSKENLLGVINHKNFSFIEHDITTPFPSQFFMKSHPISHVYHLACPTGVANLTSLGDEMLMTCAIGTKHVLDVVRFHGAKYLLASTSEIYGNPLSSIQGEEYVGNVDPIGMRSPYEEGKRFAESLTMLYVRKYGIDGVIARIFNTYGPRMLLDDSRVIPSFLSAVARHTDITVMGQGTQSRTFCYIDDLISGLLVLMQKGEKGQVYNVGSSETITIKRLAEKFLSLLNCPTSISIQFTPRPLHDHDHRMPSLKKINLLGWYPKENLTNGLRRTIAWYGF